MTQSLREQLTFRRGDFNGFAQLFFDNLATILSVLFVLQVVLRGFKGDDIDQVAKSFPEEMGPLNSYIDEIIYGRAIPGLAVTMIFGNVYYSWMGARLGAKEDRSGDVTALPYGINTPGAFAFLFSIIGPAALTASFACSKVEDINNSEDATAYRVCMEAAAEEGWKAGVVSNFLAGIISVALGAMGPVVLKAAPVVALLTSLAGIGFVFLGINQISFSYAQPIVGLLPLYLSIAAYFGNVEFGPVPKSLVIAVVGIILGWAVGVKTDEDVKAATDNVQAWGLSTGFSALGDWSTVADYIGITLPVAIAAAAGSLMNVISAERAGDKYGVPETMISDGVGTMVGAMFGTPFGTSVYIGHPAYKKMGAGITYSLINCFFFFIFAMFGLFALVDGIIPKQAISPLIFFVGMMICQEALAAAPVRQYPAVVFGLMPAVLDWAVLGGLSLGGIGNYGYWGFVSLSKADLLLALVSVSASVYFIDRNYLGAAGWMTAAAALSAFGVLHQDVVSTTQFQENSKLYCLAPRIQVNGTNAAGFCDSGFSECLNFDLFQDDEAFRCAPDSTQAWQFMVGYLMVAATAMVFFVAQKKGFVEPTIEGEDEDGLEMKRVLAETDKRISMVDPVDDSNAKAGSV